MSKPVWPVHVEYWQYECCGAAFGVGDRVSWTVVLEERGWPEEMVVELRVLGRRHSESDTYGSKDVIETPEGPEIAIDASASGDGDVLRGSLIQEHHGGAPDDLRTVAGVVRSLKIVSRRFRLADRTLTPIPDAVRLREVTRMPDRFVSPPPGDMSPEQWHEIGALAEIELD